MERAIATAIALSLAPGGCTASGTASLIAETCAVGIFLDPSRSSGAVPPSPSIRRVRHVEIDFARVFGGGGVVSAARAAGSLTLNLFPDTCVTVAREQAADMGAGRVQWIGRVEGVTDGRAILVIDGQVMVGTVRLDRRVFQISYLGEGVHAVAEIDPSAFPRD